MQPLEDAIHQVLKPMLTGRSPSDTEQDLFALPPRWGGLGLLFVPVMNFHLLAT